MKDKDRGKTTDAEYMFFAFGIMAALSMLLILTEEFWNK